MYIDIVELYNSFKNGELKTVQDVFSKFDIDSKADAFYNLDGALTDIVSFINYNRYLPFLKDHIETESLTFENGITSDGLVYIEMKNNISERLRLMFDRTGFIQYTATDDDTIDYAEKQIYIAHGELMVSNILSKSYKICRLLQFVKKV